jgi:hypothetical protein
MATAMSSGLDRCSRSLRVHNACKSSRISPGSAPCRLDRRHCGVKQIGRPCCDTRMRHGYGPNGCVPATQSGCFGDAGPRRADALRVKKQRQNFSGQRSRLSMRTDSVIAARAAAGRFALARVDDSAPIDLPGPCYGSSPCASIRSGMTLLACSKSILACRRRSSIAPSVSPDPGSPSTQGRSASRISC